MNSPAEPEKLEIELVNLKPGDSKFIKDVLSFFADPDYAPQLEMLRNGQAAIIRCPHTSIALIGPRAGSN